MRKPLVTILMLIGVLLSVSCAKNETDAPTLTLSEVGPISFPKIASEKMITITTNQEEWLASANCEWVELTQTANALAVRVLENTSTVKRKADVLIMAGSIGKKIQIEQSASDVTIVTIPDKLEIDQWSATYQFDVDANTKDWTIASDADWVNVTAKQFKSEVIINVLENTKREARVATLTLKGGKTMKKFMITQSGIMYYILPCMDFEKEFSDVKEFELARKSENSKHIDAMLSEFRTKSQAFNLIRYMIPNNTYTEATTFVKDKKFFDTEIVGFRQFLKENGFEDKGNNIFFHSAKRIQATIMPKNSLPCVNYKYIPKQPQAYKTFDKFPYGFLDFKAGRAAIEAWEATNGGVFNAGASDEDPAKPKIYLRFNVNKGDCLGRAYFIHNLPNKPKVLDQTIQYFTDMHLAFWDYNGKLILTHEFVALMEREGFTYDGESSWHVFRHNAKNLIVALRWIKYSDIDVPVLDFHIMPGSTSASINSLPRDKNMLSSNSSL